MTDIFELEFEKSPAYTVDFTELQRFVVRVGKDGKDGVDGVGIARIGYSGSDGLVDTYTVVLTDGSVTRINITNGKSPVRGTDYWTDADIALIKSYVEDAILGGKW